MSISDSLIDNISYRDGKASYSVKCFILSDFSASTPLCIEEASLWCKSPVTGVRPWVTTPQGTVPREGLAKGNTGLGLETEDETNAFQLRKSS